MKESDARQLLTGRTHDLEILLKNGRRYRIRADEGIIVGWELLIGYRGWFVHIQFEDIVSIRPVGRARRQAQS